MMLHVESLVNYFFPYICIFYRLLEDQLQETEKKSKHLEQDLRQQIEELGKENERQKQVISQVRGHSLCFTSFSRLCMTAEKIVCVGL